MNYLRSFAPWIVYAVVATQLDWRYSALIGFVLAVALLAWSHAERKPLDSTVIELTKLAILMLTIAPVTCGAYHSRMAAAIVSTVKLAAQTAVITTLVRRNSGLCHNSRSTICRAMPSVKGWPIANEPHAVVPVTFTIGYPAIVRARATKELS